MKYMQRFNDVLEIDSGDSCNHTCRPEDHRAGTT